MERAEANSAVNLLLVQSATTVQALSTLDFFTTRLLASTRTVDSLEAVLAWVNGEVLRPAPRIAVTEAIFSS